MLILKHCCYNKNMHSSFASSLTAGAFLHHHALLLLAPLLFRSSFRLKDFWAEETFAINKSNMYFVKKTLRKILRTTNKYTRYSGLATVEIELLIYFCTSMKVLDILINNNPVLFNIYQNQLKKINKTMATLHEDLQYDYQREIDKL